MFRSSHFSFLVLVTFGNEVTKIRKYYVIFVYILQGKMGKTEKNGKKITQLKWPKYQKPRRKQWDERNKWDWIVFITLLLPSGVFTNGIIILLLVTYIDTLVVIPQNISIHIFDNFKILLPFGCVMVSSIIWMFHEQRTETRELAVFISALFLALLTILHVVVLRVVSKFTFINVLLIPYFCLLVFGHFSCVIFFCFSPSCPSCLAKCKQRFS